MVKLSDALRGAADRAPLDGISVSTDAAARRVHTRRGLRVAATGIVGVTAIGVVALGVIGPNGLAMSSSDAQDAGATTAVAEAAPEAQLDTGGTASDDGVNSDQYSHLDDGLTGANAPPNSEADPGDTVLARGMCGDPMAMPSYAIEGDVVLAAHSPAVARPGTEVTVDVSLTVGQALDGAPGSEAGGSSRLTAASPGVYVLWEDLVVARVDPGAIIAYGPADEPMLDPDVEAATFATTEGTVQNFAVSVPLTNCWDGAALPVGTYQLVTTQEVYRVADAAHGTPPTVTFFSYDESAPVDLEVVGEPVSDPFAQYLDQ